MGSFRAHLELEGKEYDVLYWTTEFYRDTDRKGKPASNVYGGTFTARVESTEDTTKLEAMLNSQFKMVEGKFVFKKSDEDAKMKEFVFKNAYITRYKETLDVTGETPMTILFTLSAEEVEMGTAALNNRWPKS